jgi:hypothetical protein
LHKNAKFCNRDTYQTDAQENSEVPSRYICIIFGGTPCIQSRNFWLTSYIQNVSIIEISWLIHFSTHLLYMQTDGYTLYHTRYHCELRVRHYLSFYCVSISTVVNFGELCVLCYIIWIRTKFSFPFDLDSNTKFDQNMLHSFLKMKKYGWPELSLYDLFLCSWCREFTKIGVHFRTQPA